MKTLTFLLAGSAFVVASGAAASTPPEQGSTMADTAAEASTTAEAPDNAIADDAAATASAAAFTDEQIESFAAAALKIKALEGNAAVTQQQLVEIVTGSGLEPATYVAIAQGMKNNEALAKRVQGAAAKLQTNAAG